jgi:hypothetical protein
MYYDLVAHCAWPAAFLAEREPARWLWSGLRRMFPNPLAAAIMPNHLHLLTALEDPVAAHARFRRLLASFARSFDLPTLWNTVPEPKLVATPDKLLRQVRYIVLNPCRPVRVGRLEIQLVTDPLRYEWSTHRDAVGAIAQRWVTAEAILDACGVEVSDPAAWLHRYVSSDAHVAVSGTPMPVAGLPTTIDEALAAACATHRATPADAKRRGPVRATFLGLVVASGLDLSAATSLADTHPRSARRAPAPPNAALLCAGDDRLGVRTSWTPPADSRAAGLRELQALRAQRGPRPVDKGPWNQ